VNVRKPLLRAHRWVSLAFLAFWLVQAVTGMLLVFHWEMDDATVSGARRPVDLAAIERRAAQLAPAGSGVAVSSIWSTAGAPDRFDVSLEGEAPGLSRSVRIDGQGNVLRSRSDDERIGNGGIFTTLVLIHQKLLLGDTGSWIVGLSGMLLLSNILLGLTLAWPRRGMWKQSLSPVARGGAAARRYGRHRAIGLWAAIPAALLVSCGIMLVFEGGVSRLLRATPVEAPEIAGPTRIGLAQAAATALGRYPGSTLSGVASFPDEESAVYRIRVLQPGELRRAFGTTNIFVSAVDGRIVAEFDALTASPARRFVDSLFALHTGEAGGMLGRLAVLAIGAWLLTMITLGAALWLARRPKQTSERKQQ
jgi:uncharacterized iron-regulated membrane protein